MLSLALVGLLLLAPGARNKEAEAQVKEGQSLLKRERFEQAAAAFTEAIRLDRSLVMAHYGLGQASMALKQYPEAVVAFAGARTAFHERAADAVSRSMEKQEARDDRVRRIQENIRELQAQPLPAGSREARARDSRVQEHEIQLALLQQDRGVTGAPETPATLSLALGSAYFRSGKLGDAEREYRAALQVNPKLSETRNNLAVVLLLTGRPLEAQEQLTLAEKNGFKVPPELKRDVEVAAAKAQPEPR